MNNVMMVAFHDELEKIANAQKLLGQHKKASSEKESGFLGDMASKAKGALTTPISGTPRLNPFAGAAALSKGMGGAGQASKGFQNFQQARAATGY